MLKLEKYSYFEYYAQIDKGRVDAFDPLSRPLEQFQSLQDMLQG